MTDSLSPRLPRGRFLRTTLLLATGTVAVVALAGCSSGSTPEGSASATATPTSTSAASATPTPTATPAPSSTPTPTAAGTAVALSCDQVLTLDDVYAFNPNYGVAPGFEATSASGKTAAEFQGLNCGLLNQSSDGIIEISVAQPNDVLMGQLKTKAAGSGPSVPTYGTPPAVEGYFATAGGIGEAQVFNGTYWVTVSSTEFFEAGDAEQLVSAALSHLQ